MQYLPTFRRRDGAGWWTNYTYDGLNRLEDVSCGAGEGLWYVYDEDGNVEAIGDYGLAGWFAKTFTYDALGRPVRATSKSHMPTATFTKTIEELRRRDSIFGGLAAPELLHWYP